MKYFYSLIICLFFYNNATFGQWTASNVNKQNGLLTTLSFAQQDTGYIFGNFFFLKTIDGGQSWIRTDTPSHQKYIYTGQFISANTGFLCVRNGLLKTLDGGKTWTEMDIDSGSFIEFLYFINSSIGFAFDGGNMFVTKDGGNTWNKSMSMTSGFPSTGRMFFLNANDGFIPGIIGILHFTDSATKYSVISLPNWRNSQSVFFVSPIQGYLSGYNPNMAQSVDSGKTWEVKDSGLLGQIDVFHDITYYDVHFINKDTGYTCGSYGTIFVTTNGGLSWQQQNSGTTEDLKQFYFRSNKDIFILGAYDTLLHTTNGGFTPHTNAINQPENKLPNVNIYPNPFQSSTSVSYNLSAPSPIKIWLFDITGKQIALIASENQQPGNYQLDINAEKYHLQPGMYLIQFMLDDEYLSRSIVKF